MASIVLKDAYLMVNSVDLSAHLQQVTVDLSKDVPQSTAMGDDSHEYLADGIKDGGFSVTFRGGYAAGEADATLNTIYNLTSVCAFILKPNGSATSVTNPKFTGNCILENYNPITGSVGDVATNPATFKASGDVTRATAD